MYQRDPNWEESAWGSRGSDKLITNTAPQVIEKEQVKPSFVEEPLIERRVSRLQTGSARVKLNRTSRNRLSTMRKLKN